MDLDGLFYRTKLERDLLIEITFHNQLHDFPLPPCQVIHPSSDFVEIGSLSNIMPRARKRLRDAVADERAVGKARELVVRGEVFDARLVAPVVGDVVEGHDRAGLPHEVDDVRAHDHVADLARTQADADVAIAQVPVGAQSLDEGMSALAIAIRNQDFTGVEQAMESIHVEREAYAERLGSDLHEEPQLEALLLFEIRGAAYVGRGDLELWDDRPTTGRADDR